MGPDGILKGKAVCYQEKMWPTWDPEGGVPSGEGATHLGSRKGRRCVITGILVLNFYNLWTETAVVVNLMKGVQESTDKQPL